MPQSGSPAITVKLAFTASPKNQSQRLGVRFHGEHRRSLSELRRLFREHGDQIEMCGYHDSTELVSIE
jgi:hypothetical protein